MQQIKQLEGALAQANSSQRQVNAEAPGAYSESSIAVEDRTRGKSKNLERQDDGATRDLLSAGQEADHISKDGIQASIVYVTRLFEKNWYHRGMPIISENGLEWIASRTGQNTTALPVIFISRLSQPAALEILYPPRALFHRGIMEFAR